MTLELDPYERKDRVVQIIGCIRYAGMRLELRNGKLYVSGRTERLTDEHRADLDRYRAEVIRTLESLPPNCVVPHLCRDMGPCDSARCRQARQEAR